MKDCGQSFFEGNRRNYCDWTNCEPVMKCSTVTEDSGMRRGMERSTDPWSPFSKCFCQICSTKTKSTFDDLERTSLPSSKVEGEGDYGVEANEGKSLGWSSAELTHVLELPEFVPQATGRHFRRSGSEIGGCLSERGAKERERDLSICRLRCQLFSLVFTTNVI